MTNPLKATSSYNESTFQQQIKLCHQKYHFPDKYCVFNSAIFTKRGVEAVTSCIELECVYWKKEDSCSVKADRPGIFDRLSAV